MRTRSILGTALFGAAVTAALGFGVSSAAAATAPAATAAKVAGCPAYTSTYEQCNSCCEQVYGGFGAWSSSTHRCICGF